MAHALARINDHIVTMLHELLPWNWTPLDPAISARVAQPCTSTTSTIERVAEGVGESVEWLHNISIGMDPTMASFWFTGSATTM